MSISFLFLRYAKIGNRKIKPVEETLRKKTSRRGVKGCLKKLSCHKTDPVLMDDCREKLAQALTEFRVRLQMTKCLEELTDTRYSS